MNKSLQIVNMEMPPSPPVKAKRKPRFRTRWVRLDQRWRETLRRSKSASTYELALTILFEAFKREQVGGDIVLSRAVTGMPSTTKARAANELAELGLIKIIRKGKRALRVTIIREEEKII